MIPYLPYSDNTIAIIGTIFGGFTALTVALLKYFGNRSLRKRIDNMQYHIKEIKKERNELLKDRYELEHKIDTMKKSFNIGYNQLRTDFKNKPQKMRLWENIKETFDGS